MVDFLIEAAGPSEEVISMDRAWVLVHVGRELYRVLNNTGETARDVTFGIQGAMVATPFGNPQWRYSVEEVRPGAGIEEVFARSWGDGQAITVSWTNPSGSDESYLIPFG